MAGAPIRVTRDELASLLEETDLTLATTLEDVTRAAVDAAWRDAFASYVERWWSARARYGRRGISMMESDYEQLRLFLAHLATWQRQALEKGVTLRAPLSTRQKRVAAAVGLLPLIESGEVHAPSMLGAGWGAVLVIGGFLTIGALAWRGATRW